MSVRQALDQCKIQSDDITLRRGAVLRENEIFPEAILAGGELTIHVMPRQPVPILPDPCIRCSWCAESCPTRVQPAGLLEAAQKGDLTLARHYGLESCIECGVCSYVCPSRLPLLTGIRSLIEKARV
jgi:electron transport complex protein RnfC